MANWQKILAGSAEDLAGLLQKHAENIERTYNEAEEGQGVDINFKLVIKPGKENAVTLKSSISFTAERIKDSNKRTVTEQGDMFTNGEGDSEGSEDKK